MPKRVLQGTVVSKTDKTIIVRVERRFMHPLYKKTVKRSEKYAAHSPNNNFDVDHIVRIVESRPYSRTKRWLVVEE